MFLLAVRAIDVAIFGTLGGLWVGGAIFILVLYRWIARFERASEPTTGSGSHAVTTTPNVPKAATATLGVAAAASHG